jgi:uncharacterized protein (DUF1501 family)
MMTYSEFGRRVGENASMGTDHGTAAPHVLIGGRVKAGLYGNMPSLVGLQEGDLNYHVDYRSLYRTVVTNWWGLRATIFDHQEYPIIDCLA